MARQRKAPATVNRRGRGTTSLAEVAHARIKAAIAAHELGPGDRVRESELAERFGISRTPLRDALKQLELEGLLETAPRRGLVVATLNQERLTEMYALRDVLEELAARRAARFATEAEIAAMQQNVERQSATEDIPSLVRLNDQFHDMVYRAARNRYLMAALADLQTPLSLLPASTYQHPNRPAEALRQHSDLVAAIEHGDEAAAAAIAQEHMRAGEKIRLQMLNEVEGDGQF